MANIHVSSSKALGAVPVATITENEDGADGFRCICGHSEKVDRSRDDIIEEASIHVDLKCTRLR